MSLLYRTEKMGNIGMEGKFQKFITKLADCFGINILSLKVNCL